MSDPRKAIGQLSRRVQTAVERGPAFDAMFTTYRIIPNTWGNLASQLFELDIVEPDPEAAADFLVIERADLSDTTLQFTTNSELGDYKDRFIAHHGGKYRQSEAIAPFRAFGEYMQAAVEARKQRPDPSTLEELSAAIQQTYDDALQAPDIYAKEPILARRGLLELAHGAYRSCSVFSLAEFVGTVLGYEDESGFTIAQRASTLRRLINREILGRYKVGENTPVDKVLIGHDLQQSFVRDLAVVVNKKVMDHASAQWAIMRPLLVAPKPGNHPLFAGKEK